MATKIQAIIEGKRDHHNATRLLVQGVRHLAGFHVGYIPPHQQARREQGGPLVQGPWAYAYGIAAVIDDHGGTMGQIADDAVRNLALSCKLGDEVEIEGVRFTILPAANDNIRLELV